MGWNAALAVGVGVLLLVCLLVWMFLGRAGTFPDEAVKIAAAGAKATPEQFDPVEEKAGGLQDWFALKDSTRFAYRPSSPNSKWSASGFSPLKMNLLRKWPFPRMQCAFTAFCRSLSGINVVPEGAWRITESDRLALAVREKKALCFLVAFRGSKREMKSLLEKRERCAGGKRGPVFLVESLAQASAAVRNWRWRLSPERGEPEQARCAGGYQGSGSKLQDQRRGRVGCADQEPGGNIGHHNDGNDPAEDELEDARGKCTVRVAAKVEKAVVSVNEPLPSG